MSKEQLNAQNQNIGETQAETNIVMEEKSPAQQLQELKSFCFDLLRNIEQHQNEIQKLAQIKEQVLKEINRLENLGCGPQTIPGPKDPSELTSPFTSDNQ